VEDAKTSEEIISPKKTEPTKRSSPSLASSTQPSKTQSSPVIKQSSPSAPKAEMIKTPSQKEEGKEEPTNVQDTADGPKLGKVP